MNITESDLNIIVKKVIQEVTNKLSQNHHKGGNIYYRGTVPNETKHISTGNEFWDNNLFVSKDKALAMDYGNHITIYQMKPSAKIATERKMRIKPNKNDNYLSYLCKVLYKAKKLGYDVIEFNRQGDVGTIIINKEAIENII
jgi:hypothetical protein